MGCHALSTPRPSTHVMSIVLALGAHFPLVTQVLMLLHQCLSKPFPSSSSPSSFSFLLVSFKFQLSQPDLGFVMTKYSPPTQLTKPTTHCRSKICDLYSQFLANLAGHSIPHTPVRPNQHLCTFNSSTTSFHVTSGEFDTRVYMDLPLTIINSYSSTFISHYQPSLAKSLTKSVTSSTESVTTQPIHQQFIITISRHYQPLSTKINNKSTTTFKKSSTKPPRFPPSKLRSKLHPFRPWCQFRVQHTAAQPLFQGKERSHGFKGGMVNSRGYEPTRRMNKVHNGE